MTQMKTFLDVEIDKNSNLTDLHELILLSFNFSADQMASFYTVDEEGIK